MSQGYFQKNISWKDVFLDSSTLILIGSNVVTIVLAVVQNWSLGTIIWTYWIQSIVIGIFNATRIFSLDKFSTDGFTSNGRPVEPNSKKSKIETGTFFLLHYGGFHAIYAIFLLINFKDINLAYLGLGGLIFFLNHLFSYFHNLSQDKSIIPNLGRLMFSPYVRILPIHLTIIFVGNRVHSTMALVIFLLIKSLMDTFAHALEHKQKLAYTGSNFAASVR
jgi:hypothetical protein